MKRKHILIASVALMATSFLESCSDEFLQDKKNHDYARMPITTIAGLWLV